MEKLEKLTSSYQLRIYYWPVTTFWHFFKYRRAHTIKGPVLITLLVHFYDNFTRTRAVFPNAAAQHDTIKRKTTIVVLLLESRRLWNSSIYNKRKKIDKYKIYARDSQQKKPFQFHFEQCLLTTTHIYISKNISFINVDNSMTF